MSKIKIIKSINEEINDLFKYDAYGVVDMMLSKGITKLDVMSVDKIVTYATATHSKRDILISRKRFVEAAHAEIKSRGLDPDHILKGLM